MIRNRGSVKRIVEALGKLDGKNLGEHERDNVCLGCRGVSPLALKLLTASAAAKNNYVRIQKQTRGFVAISYTTDFVSR